MFSFNIICSICTKEPESRIGIAFFRKDIKKVLCPEVLCVQLGLSGCDNYLFMANYNI